MKKNVIKVAVICLIMGMLSTSCIGSFSLTHRLISWNKTVGNKFLNELIFFAFWILPVYEVTSLADLIVLNSIEFWSGSNPMVASQKIIEGNDGKYLVICDGKGYDIRSLNDGSVVRLDFDVPSQTWSYTLDGQTKDLFTFVDDTHVRLPLNATDSGVFEISAAGLSDYRQVASSTLWASR